MMALAGLLALGCGSNNVGNSADAAANPDAATNADAATNLDAATDNDAAPQPDATAQPDSAVDPDAAPPDSGTGSDAGAGDLVINWSSVSIWGNCMPMVPPDPWNGSFDLVYDNTAGSAPISATVLAVRMAFAAVGNPTLDITVTPTNVGPVAAGASATITHTKTGSTNDIAGDCGHCGTTVVYTITLDVGGQQVLVTSPAQQVNCAY